MCVCVYVYMCICVYVYMCICVYTLTHTHSHIHTHTYSVDCSGVRIASPPAEIVKQGPGAVARYILDLEDGADENTDVLLMFIGDGEAGKTSTLLALKNTESNTARPIGVDDRTIGIDISEFTPYTGRHPIHLCTYAPMHLFTHDVILMSKSIPYTVYRTLPYISRRASAFLSLGFWGPGGLCDHAAAVHVTPRAVPPAVEVVCMYIYIYICIYVCMYIYMYVCMYILI
jgi:hypothetical protein